MARYYLIVEMRNRMRRSGMWLSKVTNMRVTDNEYYAKRVVESSKEFPRNKFFYVGISAKECRRLRKEGIVAQIAQEDGCFRVF